MPTTKTRVDTAVSEPGDHLAPTAAAIVSLAAFALAVGTGLVAGIAPTVVLGRAVLAMAVCYPVGWVVGMALRRVVDEHMQMNEHGRGGATVRAAPEDAHASE